MGSQDAFATDPDFQNMAVQQFTHLHNTHRPIRAAVILFAMVFQQ
jgi:hypothetical protein